MLTKQLLLNLSKPNKNKWVYTSEAVQNAVDKIQGSLPGFLGTQHELDPQKVEFVVTNIQLKDDIVVGDVEFRQPSMESLIYDEHASVEFGISCVAKIDNEDGVCILKDISFTSVNLVANHT